MDKSKLRKFLFMKDKQSGISNNAQAISSNKSTTKNISLPNSTATPAIIAQEPKLPKMPKFGKIRNYFKK